MHIDIKTNPVSSQIIKPVKRIQKINGKFTDDKERHDKDNRSIFDKKGFKRKKD